MLLRVVAGLALGFIVNVADAATVPLYRASMNTNAAGVLHESNAGNASLDSYYSDGPDIETANAAVNVSGRPSLRVDYSIDDYDGASVNASARASLYYYFRLNGDGPVSVSVLSKGYVLGGEKGSYADFRLSGNGSQLLSLSNNFEDSTTLYMRPDILYEVYIAAGVGQSLFGKGHVAGEAFVDPVFVIDPAYAKDYSFTFSDGVGNSLSAVPLPASAPMFGAALLGLAGIGYAAKQRKAAAQV